ncbi:unnamed protein product, partial [Brassica oleracea]
MGVPRRFQWVTFLVSREALRHSRIWARKRHPSYTPPPRLERASLSANGPSSTSSTSVEVLPDRDPLVDAHRRLIGKVTDFGQSLLEERLPLSQSKMSTVKILAFLYVSGQMQDMVVRRDLLVQQVRASARWELMKEWLEKCLEHWNPEEEYRRHMFLSGRLNHQSGSFSQAAMPRSVVGS